MYLYIMFLGAFIIDVDFFPFLQLFLLWFMSLFVFLHIRQCLFEILKL